MSVDQIKEAAVMRAAGYSLPVIAERLNVSPRTLQRHFKAHGVKAGTLKQKVIDKAREDLLALAMDSEALMLEAARVVTDDLACARMIRERAIHVVEALKLEDHQSATEAARALAAIATTLKVTQDVARRALNMDKINAEMERETLPELVIREMTADEVEEAQRQARERLTANTI
jgi:AraC-like DNA-binding protein